MPRNGSGVSSVVNTFVIDTVADPDEVNANFTDVADQLTNSLPRDGQAGMNAPLPLQNGTAALPALTFSSDTNTGIFRKSADTVGVSGNGLEIASFGPSGVTIGSSPVVGSLYVTKSGNYTAVLADNGSKIRFTAAATLSLTAAATLLSSWSVTVIADGGAVTIDPNGSETVNGLATLVVPDGSSTTLVCDGANFFTSMRGTIWSSATFSPSAASSVIITDLGSANFIKIKGNLTQSAAGILLAQFSTNNGSTYDTGANYVAQSINGQSATISGALAPAASGFLLSGGSNSDAGTLAQIDAEIFGFNKANQASGFSRSYPIIGGVRVFTNLALFHNSSSARNALRILNAGGGTITGSITVEWAR